MNSHHSFLVPILKVEKRGEFYCFTDVDIVLKSFLNLLICLQRFPVLASEMILPKARGKKVPPPPKKKKKFQ